jgi:hypothetical protein
MNYGEEIAYWYFRLNGFFPITNFVINRSSEIDYSSDCDLLAIRLPYVYEEIGGTPEDWDDNLIKQLGFDLPLGVICEVKTGSYELEDVFRTQYVKYSIGRLGLVPKINISDVSKSLEGKLLIEVKEKYRICKLLIANQQKESVSFFYRSLDSVEDFINDRVRKYPAEKYADRMFFGSVSFQQTIHRIHREVVLRAKSKSA